ncbi:hypothetical protein [Lachnospira multipara]|uniref:Uncharacterized protein n=1 Tax=Lachnospira multipara TaxID=28051 RepID=A0A1H5SUA1_9FIRM|nr:hypothetical protein [Lachnospira multipara]SEF53367.1 hypothetical protein SAMN05216537_103101 [Lachnospira multipara]
MNNETMLSSLVSGVRDNKINKEEFYKKMYEDVYALVYPIMKNKKDSKDYTEDAIDYIYNNLSQINLDKNIYRQIASLVSSFLVKDLLEDASEYELKDCAYSYDNLKEDKELLNICKNNVTAFRNVKDFKGCGKKFKTLPSVLMAMLELFGYEMRSIGEIAKLTNLSEDKVRGFLNEIRRHYGYEILDGYVLKEDSQELNDLEGFEFIDDNTNPNLEPIVKEDLKESKEASEISEAKKVSELSVAKKDSETKKAREADFEEDEEDEGKKAGPVVGFFARLFPDLSVSQARIVTVALFGLVVAVVAVLVFVPLLGKDEVASDQVQVESTTEAESETETSEATTASQTKAATTKATVESTTEATKSSNSTTTSSTETTTEATEATSSNDSQDSSKSQNSNNSQNVEESGKESGEGSSNGSTQKTDDNTEANATKATQEATTEAASN